MSLHGFCLILNQAHAEYASHAGHGRVFIGLEPNQQAALRAHIDTHQIQAKRTEWGQPTAVIGDPDGNELFFWMDHHDAWIGELPSLHQSP